MAAQIEAVGAGEHDVEKKQGGHFPKSFRDYRGAAHEALDVESGGLEIVSDEAGNVFFIFDDEDKKAGRQRRIHTRAALVRIQRQLHFVS